MTIPCKNSAKYNPKNCEAFTFPNLYKVSEGQFPKERQLRRFNRKCKTLYQRPVLHFTDSSLGLL